MICQFKFVLQFSFTTQIPQDAIVQMPFLSLLNEPIYMILPKTNSNGASYLCNEEKIKQKDESTTPVFNS